MGRAASSCCEVLLRDIYNTACQGHTKHSSPQHHDLLPHTEAVLNQPENKTLKTLVSIDNIPVASKKLKTFNLKGQDTTLKKRLLCSQILLEINSFLTGTACKRQRAKLDMNFTCCGVAILNPAGSMRLAGSGCTGC